MSTPGQRERSERRPGLGALHSSREPAAQNAARASKPQNHPRIKRAADQIGGWGEERVEVRVQSVECGGRGMIQAAQWRNCNPPCLHAFTALHLSPCIPHMHCIQLPRYGIVSFNHLCRFRHPQSRPVTRSNAPARRATPVALAIAATVSPNPREAGRSCAPIGQSPASACAMISRPSFPQAHAPAHRACRCGHA